MFIKLKTQCVWKFNRVTKIFSLLGNDSSSGSNRAQLSSLPGESPIFALAVISILNFSVMELCRMWRLERKGFVPFVTCGVNTSLSQDVVKSFKKSKLRAKEHVCFPCFQGHTIFFQKNKILKSEILWYVAEFLHRWLSIISEAFWSWNIIDRGA